MRAVLTYHSLDETGSPVSMDPARFREHANWLASGDVPVVDLPELLALPPEADAVAVTFDDGFRNFASRAWPILRERGIPATLFIVTEHVGGHNDWESAGERTSIPELPLLGWEELRQLAEEGVTIGSHTMTHPDLTRLEPEAAEHEVAGSADRIEDETGRRPRCFAYPYGRANDAAERSTGEHYAVACAVGHREIRDDDPPRRIPRLEAGYFRRRHLERWGTPLFRARLRARAGARRLRRTLAGDAP